MKAIGITAAHQDEENRGKPITALSFNYVHLQPSLTGTYQSYKLAADVATLDALEAEDTCIVLMRFEDVDEDGAPTYIELNEPHAELEAVFNAFMAQIGQPQFPAGTTPRQILGAFGINPDGYDVYDGAQ